MKVSHTAVRRRFEPRAGRVAARGLATLGVAAAVGLVSACATTVHAVDGPPPFEDPAAVKPARVLAQYTRRIRPAHNVDIVATLWDPALLAAEARTIATATAGPRESEQEARDRLERWRERYLEAQTSFTVVLELANRPGPPRARRGAEPPPFEDPWVEPESWSFSLEREDGEAVTPRRIEVQAVDRFPTRAGGHHYRIAYAVHFDGAPLDPDNAGDAAGPHALKLRVRPLIRDRSTSGLGRGSTRRGFAITWWLDDVAP